MSLETAMMYDNELDFTKHWIRQAGEKILTIYREADLGIELKEDDSPVTRADKISNDLLVSAYQSQFNDGILSEESVDDPIRLTKERVWIIDPLDGTKEFIKRNDEFCICIALVRHQRPVLGAIYLPVMEELYYAVRDQGAFRERGNRREALHVSSRVNHLRLLRSRSHLSDLSEQLFNMEAVASMEKLGAALKGCRIAAGEAEIHCSQGSTKEWDCCAMEIILEEAGGIFRQLNGERMLYNRVDPVNRHGFYMVNRAENILW